jgi:TonB family protein
MSKAYVLPAAIFVAALPMCADGQSVRRSNGPIYAPPSPPAPPAPPVFAAPPVPMPSVAPPSPPMPVYVTQPEPVGSPASWFTSDDYPALAKRAGEQGKVSIRLIVSATGRPLGCAVVVTSGSRTLDDATCRLATQRGRFAPPRDAAGNPVPFYYFMSMRWELPEPDGLDFDLNGSTVDIARGAWSRTLLSVAIDIDKEGKGVACRSVLKPVPDAVACEGFTVGRQMMEPVLRAGRPVPATITLDRSIQVAPRLLPRK